jgi:acyl dehydratase
MIKTPQHFSVPRLCFEDVAVGQQLPPVKKTVSTRQLVMYAGASGDFVPIHYDKDKAAAAGHPKVVVHGALKSAFLAQVITDWMGETGRLLELSIQYRGVDYPDDPLTCRGRVTAVRRQGAQGHVELEVWAENGQGQVTTPGKALVALPIRGLIGGDGGQM